MFIYLLVFLELSTKSFSENLKYEFCLYGMLKMLSLILMYVMQIAEWVVFHVKPLELVHKMLDICFIVWASPNSTWVYYQYLEGNVLHEDLEHRDATQISTAGTLPPSLYRTHNCRYVPAPRVVKQWSESWRPPHVGYHPGTCGISGWIGQWSRPLSWPTPAVTKKERWSGSPWKSRSQSAARRKSVKGAPALRVSLASRASPL